MRILVFEVEGRNYALSAEVVRQIDHPAPVTPLPFVPDYVEGLTATAGKVLPQIDLAARLGLGTLPSGGELIVVAGAANDCVYRISRCRRMVEVADDDLVPVGNDDLVAFGHGECEADGESEDGSGRDGMLAAQFQVDGEPVFLLRPEAIGLDGLRTPQLAPGGGNLLGDAEVEGASRHAVVDAEITCLVVAVGPERYAFPLERVSEVYTDYHLTVIPNAAGFVGGLSVLRGLPRLVVSLSRLLGLPAQGTETRMVVAEAGGLPLVFQCDGLLGIRRFPESRREPAGDGSGCVDSHLIGDDGAVTGLLSLDLLICPDTTRALSRHLPQVRDHSQALQAAEKRKLLLVHSGSETCGIDIARVERVAGYTPPTEMPSAGGMAVGMTDIAGRVLPVADLGAVFGARGGTPTAYVVVRTSRSDGFGAWAVAVEELERLTEIPISAIRSTGGAPGDLVVGVGRVGERLVSILDVDVFEGAASDDCNAENAA